MTHAQAVTEIHALNAKFMERGNAKDPAGLVHSFYAEDAVLMPPGAPANVTGWPAIVKFWDDMIFVTKAVDLSVSTVSVEVSGDMAAEIGIFSYNSPDKNGVLTNTNGKYVVVYKVVEGVGLKASIDIFSENE